MFYGQNRQDTRLVFFNAWEKHLNGHPLQPLEIQLVDVIKMHPEYHAALANINDMLERDYMPELGETNPFLHMGLHLAISEQIAIDQPSGIVALYHSLLPQYQDAHQTQHLMMDCLAQAIWQAQREGQAPDNQHYLACIRRLLTG